MGRGLVTISAGSRSEFKAAVLGLKAAPKEVRRRISQETRDEGNPIWQQAIAKRVGRGDELDGRLFPKGARIAAGNPSQAVAASSRRVVTRDGGGLVPDRDARAFEFGRNREKWVDYDRGGKGRAHVRRRVQRGLPTPNKTGRVVYPAWSDTAPRLVSLWVQTIVRVIHEAYEGKVR